MSTRLRLLFVGFFLVLFCSAIAQQPVELAQANVAAEIDLLKMAEDYQAARRAVTKAIDGVSDLARQKLLRDALAANDATWAKLIDTETALRQATICGLAGGLVSFSPLHLGPFSGAWAVSGPAD